MSTRATTGPRRTTRRTEKRTPLAQLAEQGILNPRVTGSSPVGRTVAAQRLTWGGVAIGLEPALVTLGAKGERLNEVWPSSDGAADYGSEGRGFKSLHLDKAP